MVFSYVLDADVEVLIENLGLLKSHFTEELSATELKDVTKLITENEFALQKSQEAIDLAFEVVKLYETT